MMRSDLILVIALLMLAEIGPSLAAHESGKVGPYVVSFDVNTTVPYKVIVDPPTSGTTSDGAKFTRCYLSVDGDNGYASIILTGYEKNMSAGISANRDVVASALSAIGGSDSKIYPSTVGVDGEQAVLGSCKYATGEQIFIASYSPDAAPLKGEYVGRTDCRFVSTYSWEITRNILGTLHVEVPK